MRLAYRFQVSRTGVGRRQFGADRNLIDLRFPVQYVLRPDRTFRGYLGSVASGTIKPGDEVMVIPSGRKRGKMIDPMKSRLDHKQTATELSAWPPTR